MRKALALVLSLGLIAAACGGDSVLTTEASTTTTDSVPTESTDPATTTSAAATTTEPGPEEPLPGSLASLAGQTVEDPLMASGGHLMEWGDDGRTVLESERSTTDSGPASDLLDLVSYVPAPAVSGFGPDDVLVHAFIAFPTMEVAPGGLVVYTPGADAWVPALVVTDEALVTALEETTDYQAAAPDGEPLVDFTPSSLDGGASILVGTIQVRDAEDGQVAYEGEIECDFSGDLACLTLTDDGVLRPGDVGEDVEALQQQLKDLGYLSGAVDGKYGPGTAAAVRAFQRDYLLTRDGKVGPMTRDLLDQVVAGTSGILLASKDGIGPIAFGTGSDAAYADLIAALGVPDSNTGWYVDGCDGNDWYKATWDGFTAVFTDRNGTRQLDGWQVDDLSDLPAGLYVKHGIHGGTDWGDLESLGADYFNDYLGQRWRIPDLGYTNGRFIGPVADPPAANSKIASFGTGTGGFESC